MKKYLVPVLAAGLLLSQPVAAKIIHLLPSPQQVSATAGAAPFALGRSVALSDSLATPALERMLTGAGCTIDAGASARVVVDYVGSIPGAYDFTLAGFPNEGYALTISADEVRITAASQTGVIRAAQTLEQLAAGYDGTPALEALSMTDWPAFKLRGYMHDVGRSFVSVDQLKRQIDILAKFKLNVFHWHLTENQAWRFEVKAYPALTSAASMTRFAGQYYTQEECRDVQNYAAERGVEIIPEIDMPGHSAAFVRAMGHDMQTDAGVEELLTILEEVCAVFDKATYIHIGGDEVTITYSGFLEKMIAKVKSLGKEAVVWNPINGVNVSGLDAAMTQMWSTRGTSISGKANVDCRYNYTNHFDVFADLVGIFKSNIYYKAQGDATVPGFISAPWNDRMTPTEADIIRQNNVYAATIACGERAWKGGGKQYIEVGGTTLPISGDEYDEFASWEERFLFHKANTFSEEATLVPYVRQANVRWRVTDGFPNGGDASAVFPPETEGLQESYTYNGATYGTTLAAGAGIYLSHTWSSVVPGLFGKSPASNQTAYAYTYVYSPIEQDAGALIEFQNYGRSENDRAPEAGKWDRKGSQIFLNDEEILPPTWANTGKTIGSEVPLQNENFTARPATQIHLQQGWNKVFLKLPYVSASGVRLNKWLFTFVVTDTEGRDALDGLVYSPGRYLDAEAEAIAAQVGEARKVRDAYISDAVGYYGEDAATAFDAAIAEAEEALASPLTAAEKTALVERIQAAQTAFLSGLSAFEINQPKASTATDVHHYQMYTPLRNSLYPTSNGAGAQITGIASPTLASTWRFETRTDGTFNIVNASDGTYISPNSTYNTALVATAAVPSAGWTIKKADAVGYVIITAGSRQMNQTNINARVYNWGNGTNTTDTGCKYRILETDLGVNTGIDEVALPAAAADASSAVYDLSGRRTNAPQKGGIYIVGRRKRVL